MPRKSIGPRPLTPAERQAHQRVKRQKQWEQLVLALETVTTADRVTEAREIARGALERIKR